MMRAYIDESGHESKGWIFVAGFVGTEQQWTDFVPKWREGLGPKRSFLHLTDLRWKKDRTRRLLETLGPIPHQCGLEVCMGGVRAADYYDLIVGTEDEKLMKGYLACLMPMVLQVIRGIPKEERIEFVFEEQREYAEVTNMMMSYAALGDMAYKVTSSGLPKLAKWSFVPKGTTIMLDPSDYLAFALREEHMDRNSKKAEWTRPILSAGDGTGYGMIANQEQARRMVTRARELFNATWPGAF